MIQLVLWRPRVGGVLKVVALAAMTLCAQLVGCGGDNDSDSGTDADARTDAGSDAASDMGSDALVYPDAGAFDGWTALPDNVDAGPPITLISTPTFGPAMRVVDVSILQQDGLDLDGDGIFDNGLGSLVFGTEQLDDFFSQGLVDGTVNLIVELRGFEPGPAPGPFTLFFHLATMSKNPDAFYVAPDSLDAAGIPRVAARARVIDVSGHSMVTTVMARRNAITGEILAFDLVQTSMLLSLEPASDGVTPDGMTLILGGVLQACTLASFGDIIFGTDSLFDLLAGLGLQPDFDLSGDGLESVTLAIGLPPRVGSCVDGDGSIIPSFSERPCACDERIEDGFSIALRMEAVPATLLGLAP